jgi:hypothetical protein
LRPFLSKINALSRGSERRVRRYAEDIGISSHFRDLRRVMSEMYERYRDQLTSFEYVTVA